MMCKIFDYQWHLGPFFLKKYRIFPQVYINNEYDTSTMASLDNSDEDEDEAEDEEEDDDEDEDDDEEDEEEVKEKMVFSSSAGERMLISISGDRCGNILFCVFPLL